MTQNENQPTSKSLQPGAQAPDFTLSSAPGETVSLHDFRGQPVVLVFYPADWSPVCGSQIALYNEILPEFEEYNAKVIGISTDTAWSHTAYVQQNNVHFPLLSDFEPKGEVAKKYGVYYAPDGTSERALFVIDQEGIIHWSHVSPGGVEAPSPGADGILKALDELGEKQESR